MMQGFIHSTESFGAVDGPGIRFVIFFAGCPMRCRYCHNPDTWTASGAGTASVRELLDTAERYRSYWGRRGGITASGGEPLYQPEFLRELFREARSRGISTVLDTSGQPFTREEPFYSLFLDIMEHTDLVLLDIKEMDENKHRELTGHDNRNILDMARCLSDLGKPMWIRHVLVPGVTDFDPDLRRLRELIDTLRSVERVEVLPYHSMGEAKWQALGIPYRLAGTEPPTAERMENAKRILLG